MAMSRDPRSKFGKKIIFFLILHLILGTVTKFLVEKLSTSEVISQKPHGGVETPPPSAFMVKERQKLSRQQMTGNAVQKANGRHSSFHKISLS